MERSVYFPRDYEIASSAYARESTGPREKPETFSEVYSGKFSPVVSEDKRNPRSRIGDNQRTLPLDIPHRRQFRP